MYSQRVYQLFAKNRKKKRKDEIDGSRIAFVVSFLFCFFPLPFCSGVDITLLLSVPSTKRHELSGVSHKKKREKRIYGYVQSALATPLVPCSAVSRTLPCSRSRNAGHTLSIVVGSVFLSRSRHHRRSLQGAAAVANTSASIPAKSSTRPKQ